MQIVVVGQGYVGLLLAVRAAEAGHRVIACDVDVDRVRAFTSCDSHAEDVPSTRLRAVLDAGSYRASADEAALAGHDTAVITVPTPLRDGVPDLGFIEACARTPGKHLRRSAAPSRSYGSLLRRSSASWWRPRSL
ncbi:hypothetical protein [Streptomyces sp. NPDC051109]|uniref:hypothetical protein n=1 Tax=Streptomyces sp. NPDC051109 TaxID=3365642 RepID=UPI003794C68E